MRGVCLFGGSGTRLGRWTRRVANKHLVLIGDKTIADLVAEQMVSTGLTRCCFITGANHAGQLVGYFGDGKEWGFDEVEYRFQYNPDGIPSALGLAESYCAGHEVFLHLGDNVIEHDFKPDWDAFVKAAKAGEEGCRIFLREVPDPRRFGVAEVSGDRIVSLEEKPQSPKSNLAVIGAYFFDSSVFERVRALRKSTRGETEVTDLVRSYLADSRVGFSIVKGFYADAGVPEQIARVVRWHYRKTFGRDIDP